MPGKGVAAIATMTRLDRAGTYPSFAQRKSDCIPSRHCNATIGYRPPTVLKWNEDDEPLPLGFPCEHLGHLLLALWRDRCTSQSRLAQGDLTVRSELKRSTKRGLTWTSREFSAPSAIGGALPRNEILKALGIAILTTVLVLLVIAAQAATYISGTVKDQGGRPVKGAIVTLTDRQLGRATSVYTGSDGSFKILDVKPGPYDLRVRRVGYTDLEQSAVSITGKTPEMKLHNEHSG